jgi:hypothetical protein
MIIAIDAVGMPMMDNGASNAMWHACRSARTVPV